MATIAVFVAFGGGAYAAISSIPGPDGVIHGCYKKKKGNLRVVAARKKCSHSERALSWNQVGRQGPQGIPGAPGAKGDKGDIGPSNAFEVFRDAGPANIGTTPVTVATLANLPAGSYVVSAKTELTSPSAGSTDVACTLRAEGDSDTGDAFIGGGTSATFFAMIPLTLTHTFSGVGAVTLSCAKDLAATANVNNTKIVAIKVGTETHSAVTG
jgi:hypothetical protein